MSIKKAGNNTVLLVDDEVDVLKSYELTLKSRQIQNVITCSDSTEAIPILEKTAVDVIVLDLMMPKMTGEELLTIISEKFPGIPVIIVTAVNDVETAVRCLTLGAKDYMLKPTERNRFVSGIKRLLEMKELQRVNQSLIKHLFSDTVTNPQAFSHIITQNSVMLSIFKYVEAVAESNEPVLITGETGVGKELMAQAIHQLSQRKGRFISVNVAGLDDNVFSDTLFGHLKGAFTDAHQPRSGLVEEAKGGTLFLDEIGDLNLSSQIKLLRLLQEKEYYPLGSDRIKRTDCRVLCTTNRQLEEGIEKGLFRNDLYFRLRTHHIDIPPLKERMDDLPLLLKHFFKESADSMKKEIPTASLEKEVFRILSHYDFPGNLRELRALVFDVVTTGSADTIFLKKIKQSFKLEETNGESNDMFDSTGRNVAFDLSQYAQLPSLQELEEMAIREAMKRSGGNMSQAAKLLGIHRQTMSKKMLKIQI